MSKKIYISGQITGLPLIEAKVLFTKYYIEIKNSGNIPINPFDILPFQEHLTWKDYMIEDIKALMDCDAILMLPNWLNSKGAKIEHAIAEKMGLEILYCKNHNLF